MNNKIFHAVLVIIVASVSCFAQTSGIGETPKPKAQDDATASQGTGRWYGKVGIAGAIYHPAANISAGGAPLPGSTVTLTNDVTATVDVGYYFTKNIAASLMAGVPPKPTIGGAGTIESYGELGAVRYGPAIASAHYHFLPDQALQPYLGVGVAYAIVFKNHDKALTSLKVNNNFAPVVQGGADYMFNKHWGTFVDCKFLWLSMDARGKIGGVVPVSARVKIYPSIVSAGLKYRF